MHRSRAQHEFFFRPRIFNQINSNADEMRTRSRKSEEQVERLCIELKTLRSARFQLLARNTKNAIFHGFHMIGKLVYRFVSWNALALRALTLQRATENRL